MGNLIRLALIFFAFYLLLRLLASMFGFGKRGQSSQHTEGDKQADKSVLDKLGDYIDYEEVKEKEK